MYPYANLLFLADMIGLFGFMVCAFALWCIVDELRTIRAKQADFFSWCVIHHATTRSIKRLAGESDHE